jgi:carboxypeptidase Q
MRQIFASFLVTTIVVQSYAGDPSAYDSVGVRLVRASLGQNLSYTMLVELCTTIGPRLSGSLEAAKAVEFTKAKMLQFGFANVHTEPVMVPHWVRGKDEAGWYFDANGVKRSLHIAALGGSMGTPKKGITSEIVEVKSWDELKELGAKVKGKIVFFNRSMDRSLLTPGQAYGRAVDQRSRGAIEAARYGAVAALIRSMTTRLDDFPHTGSTHYADSIPKVPAAAVSTNDAEKLSTLLRTGKQLKVGMRFSCETLPDVESANVMGELVGTEHPEEIIVIGGHLDSWDKGHGAHDDGAGCIHAIEALRLLKELGFQPKRTIRAVMFINEENGLRGGTAYAEAHHPREKHIAAIESDAGGFMPRGFGVSDSAAYQKLVGFTKAFWTLGADHIVRGGGGVDISPLTNRGVPSLGLNVDTQRYFDYHHSGDDTIDKVSEREMAYGSAALALMAYIIAQEGL